MTLKRLNSILEGTEIVQLVGDPNAEIADLKLDSREVKAGDLFVAMKGSLADGHKFIEGAIGSGAIAILCEAIPERLHTGVSYVQVRNVRKALGVICKRFFDDPSAAFKLVGITGTNGKTTCCTLLYDCMEALGLKAGLISTVNVRIHDQILSAERTTPDVISLNRLMADMRDAGCAYVFMEVSSHAIDQGRIEGLHFSLAAFTNITRDHLDYHGDFRSYIEVKKKFFDNLYQEAIALTNLDDPNGAVMLQNSSAQKYTYSFRRPANYKGRILTNTLDGLQLEFNGIPFHARLLGAFNAYNLLTVYAICELMGFDSWNVLQILSQVYPAEGRFDVIRSINEGKTGIVDYAHTPDALEKVLETVRKVISPKSKIICVFGCGGDRDKGKRPIMTSIAFRLSDIIVMTSDNPRSEDPEVILDEMMEGIKDEHNTSNCLRITDRTEAIKTAVMLAGRGDVVVVAGKGHEKYQEIKGKKFPFDDKKILEAIML